MTNGDGDMKIRISIFILVFALLLCSCGTNEVKYDKVSIGMTYEEFHSFMDGKDVFSYGHYAFWTDENGNEIVVRFSNPELKIDRIEHFPRQGAKPTSEDFEKISVGMDMFDVVERVGKPFRSVTSGLMTLDFLAEDETVYRVSFDTTDIYKVIEWYVVK
jgi:hypothetical protein